MQIVLYFLPPLFFYFPNLPIFLPTKILNPTLPYLFYCLIVSVPVEIFPGSSTQLFLSLPLLLSLSLSFQDHPPEYFSRRVFYFGCHKLTHFPGYVPHGNEAVYTTRTQAAYIVKIYRLTDQGKNTSSNFLKLPLTCDSYSDSRILACI